MTRINRKLSFFKQNYNFIFGILWLLMGITYFLNYNLSEGGSVNFNLIMAVIYVILSSLYFYMGYKNLKEKGEYIEWDSHFLKYKPNMGKIHSYKIDELICITVSKTNLIIKAPNAQGTMAPLKGYAENDLLKLRDAFQKN